MSTLKPDANNQLKPSFTIAVRSLVEHVLRCGDLHMESFGAISALEGLRAHQKIQRLRPAGYQAEVPVGCTMMHADYQLTVTGRIDGVLVEESRTVIEEIKTTRRSLDDVEKDPNPVHWGQAQCYAYLFAVQENISVVVVRLTYANLEDGRIRELERVLSLAELERFFNELLKRYMTWLTNLAHWAGLRDQSIQRLDFPFGAYRNGQRDLAVAVYRTVREGGHLLIQAATGIGKTMATLFPAVKALGDKLTDKVIFLTARGTGRLAAETALDTLRSNGLRLKSVTLTAKDKICFFPQGACTPEECECARGYFDRINDAVSEALTHDALTRDRIEQIAGAHRVCPFEFSLELVSWADSVICDYNYAFAPGVKLQRLFEEGGGRHTVLVDEAHNLVDRSRDMFSAQLAKNRILTLRRLLKKEIPSVHAKLGRINSWLATERRRCTEAGGTLVQEELSQELILRLRDFLWSAEKWLTRNARASFRDALLDLFFDIVHFMRIAEIFDRHYAMIQEATADELRIKLFCVDPSPQLRQAWQSSRAAILFSATLAPVGYFQSVLGCSNEASMLNLPSPFPPSNLAVFIADKISTFFKDRKHSCTALVSTIADMVVQHTGHYLLYFPSYEYLQMVHNLFSEEYAEVKTVVQTPEMGEHERAAFLEHFENEVNGTLVGFAIMGGIFGEGIDLKGERLTGAIIVGVGLPGICLERDLIRDYYNRVMGCGFEFAYQFPGTNRVLQAAGRVIRSENDQGMILLIDRRYGQQRYRSLLPQHWQLQYVGDGTGFQQQIKSFWKALN